MSNFKALFFLILFALISCNENSKKTSGEQTNYPKVDSLYKLVVAKHDEVMPKTADISKLTKILRGKLDSVKNDPEKEKILNLLQSLQSAHDAMFDWMGEFKGMHTNMDFYKTNSEQELLNYLGDEEVKIDRVAKLMLESIANSELYLKDNKN
jgi:hypothetical protein